MYRTITKQLSFALVVCGLTATLALAQAGGGVGAAQGGTGGGSGVQDNRGTTGMTGSTGTMDKDNKSQPADNTGGMRPTGETSTECVTGTGVGAVPCMPVSGSKVATPPGTGPQQGGTVVK